MPGPNHPSRTLFPRSRLPHPRLHLSRLHSTAEETGPCALEDYSYLVGESLAMRSVRAQMRRVSPHLRVALITGEDGTGKEAVALALHRLGTDSDATFFSHTPASLLGAFSELLARCNGLAAGTQTPESAPATLFLPEAGDLTYGEQMYLRHALRRLAEYRSSGPRLASSSLASFSVAGTSPRAQIPRLIFATGRDLRSLASAGHFDRTLYRAISAVEIVLPPLRARTEDIPLITCGMLSRSPHPDGSAIAFDGRALSRLQCYDWPGNVRELEHVVEVARQNAGDGVIEAIHLPLLGEFARAYGRDGPDNRPDSQPDSQIDRLDDVIQSHVLDVLVRCSGNKVRAAERLGISRSTLYRMLDASAHERAS